MQREKKKNFKFIIISRMTFSIIIFAKKKKKKNNFCFEWQRYIWLYKLKYTFQWTALFNLIDVCQVNKR